MAELQSLPASVTQLLDGARNALARSENALSYGDSHGAHYEAKQSMMLIFEAVKCLAPHDPMGALALIGTHLGYDGIELEELFEDEQVTYQWKEMFGIKYGADVTRIVNRRSNRKRMGFY
jgi:hypothetical protein